MFEHFELVHVDGYLYARVVIDGVAYTKDVTSYFKKANGHDDWLDYRLHFDRLEKQYGEKKGDA